MNRECSENFFPLSVAFVSFDLIRKSTLYYEGYVFGFWKVYLFVVLMFFKKNLLLCVLEFSSWRWSQSRFQLVFWIIPDENSIFRREKHIPMRWWPQWCDEVSRHRQLLLSTMTCLVTWHSVIDMVTQDTFYHLLEKPNKQVNQRCDSLKVGQPKCHVTQRSPGVAQV